MVWSRALCSHFQSQASLHCFFVWNIQLHHLHILEELCFLWNKGENFRWPFPAWLCGNGPQQGRTFVGVGPATCCARAASRAASGATDLLRCDTAEVAREGHGVAREGWANLGIFGKGRPWLFFFVCFFFSFSMGWVGWKSGMLSFFIFGREWKAPFLSVCQGFGYWIF